MKSIQTKIVALMVLVTLVSSLIIGGIGINSYGKVMDEDTNRIMNLICTEYAKDINGMLETIEQEVTIVADYITDNLADAQHLTDEEYLEEFTAQVEELALTVAKSSTGVICTYVRYNPELTKPTAGYYKVKNPMTHNYYDEEITDLSKYEVNDIENLGWYYIPVMEKKPMWIMPYHDSRIDVDMISYVYPIYIKGELIGVCGMDVNFDTIKDMADSITMFETGHSNLADDKLNIIHSVHITKGTNIRDLSDDLKKTDDYNIFNENTLFEYKHRDVENYVTFRKLKNGMCLAAVVPKKEINNKKNDLAMEMVIGCIIIIGIFSTLAFRIAVGIVKPLKELDVAAKSIAAGNLDIELESKSSDEVGRLTDSLKETVKQLRIRIDYINNLAYQDKLTGVLNNTAYLYNVAKVKEKIRDEALSGEKVDFSVFLVDVNGLKSINDQYGHEYGNQLIISVSEKCVKVFGEKNVYRIGGDEFAVLMKGHIPNTKGYIDKFYRALEEDDSDIHLEAAIGVATYDREEDSCYEDVFKRADECMYEIKRDMKKEGRTSKVKVAS